MRLYIIRHGESFVNLPDWQNRETDTPLTEKGHAQARALAEWLPRNIPRVDALYASTLQRAAQTAEYVAEAYRLTALPEPRLREIGANAITHQSHEPAPMQADYATFWSSEAPFANITPGLKSGESMMHFRTRVGQCLEDLLAKHLGQRVIAVSHGGVIDTIFDYAFNVGPWRRTETWTYNTGITCFEYVAHSKREVWRLHYHNRIDHLPDADAIR
ncbi:MAG: histidine phosphatase family protein [Anaerolineales bacterium]